MSASSQPSDTKPSVTVPAGDPPTSLQLDDLVVGDGREAASGKVVMVHYVGVAWSSGEQFDASWDRNESFDFRPQVLLCIHSDLLPCGDERIESFALYATRAHARKNTPRYLV